MLLHYYSKLYYYYSKLRFRVNIILQDCIFDTRRGKSKHIKHPISRGPTDTNALLDCHSEMDGSAYRLRAVIAYKWPDGTERLIAFAYRTQRRATLGREKL